MATLYKIRNNIIYDLIAELSGARFRARVSIYDWHGRGSGGGWAGGLEKRSKYAAAKSTIRKIAELRERYVRLAIPEDSLVHRPPHSGYAPTFNPPTYSPPRPCERGGGGGGGGGEGGVAGSLASEGYRRNCARRTSTTLRKQKSSTTGEGDGLRKSSGSGSGSGGVLRPTFWWKEQQEQEQEQEQEQDGGKPYIAEAAKSSSSSSSSSSSCS
ncbi:hypothetical protein V9T40_007495 [Parthenolecanium corni]|uniref:Uncharacterized protein n=1 Tax=Parthenolecanium corni TaxID=536013 RepID=A0AAN9TJZ7_9HEMI